MFIKKKISISNTFLFNMIFLATCSTLTIGYFWISHEYSRFSTDAETIRHDYIASRKATIRKEVEAACECVSHYRAFSFAQLKQDVQTRVDNACNTAGFTHAAYHGRESDANVRQRITDALGRLRWSNGRSVIQIVSLSGKIILSPDAPALAGKYLTDAGDSEAARNIRQRFESARAHGDGVTEDSQDRTVLCARAFSPFNWIIFNAESVRQMDNRIQQKVIRRLAAVRFEKEGYLFGIAYDGSPLFLNGEIIRGRSRMWNLSNPATIQLFQTQRNAVRNPDGGYIQYAWKKLRSEDIAQKISFVKGIPGWQWIVGAGVYSDEIDTVIEEKRELLRGEVRERTCIVIAILLIQIVIICVIARYIAFKSRTSFDLFSCFFSRAATAATEIRSQDLHFSEFATLASAANRMVQARISAETAHRESEETYRNLFQNAQVGLFRTKPDKGIFVECNEALARMFGYNTRQAFMREYSLRKGYVDIRVRHKMMSVIRKEGEIRNFEARFRGKEGQIVWLRYSARYFPEQDWIEGVAEDITDIRAAEQEKKKLRNRLNRSRKMEGLGFLAGSVAHDLNNILSGIVTYPDLMLVDLPPDSRLRKPLETIRETGQRATAVVSDLLTMARGTVCSQEVMSVNDVIREYLTSPEHRDQAEKYKDISVNMQLNAGTPNIRGAAIQIRQTLMNLVTNAFESISICGEITVATRTCRLDAPLKGYDNMTGGEYVVVAVCDTGSGISEKDLVRIFEPFYTQKTMGRNGTGLGLAVVWNTVHDHGGYIDVTSNAAGTVFELYFPATSEKIAKAAFSPDIQAYTGSGEKILIVDDDADQREIASGFLIRLGYSVHAVEGGEKALEYMKTNSAELILLDMIMEPGMNGRETYERIIRMRPGQKAIFATGFSEIAEMDRPYESGSVQYVCKPYTFEKIGPAIRKALV
ncbi:hypothetical protein DENIS_1718 [Desulfonema ishimotonii]|uniref:histidine kinase n=1 Tax=Desulfonema ishimotonii TaxID=45657 RepID=A0A401FUW6_9BACT|nr:cache domain-containing protein [Desulfonema ishimotonii]GBC60759.1 hypothetical protein DENIS_1718 [Desulfonema ishimotonii]